MLLLDEPLSQPRRQAARADARRAEAPAATAGITSIFVTHDQVESMALADRIIVMNRGRIEQVGTPARHLRAAAQPLRERVRRLDQPAARRRHRTSTATRLTCATATHEIQCAAPRRRSSSQAATAVVVVDPAREAEPGAASAATAALNVWAGRVASAAYYGDHREYEIEVSDQRLKVITPASVTVDRGEPVYRRVRPSRDGGHAETRRAEHGRPIAQAGELTSAPAPRCTGRAAARVRFERRLRRDDAGHAAGRVPGAVPAGHAAVRQLLDGPARASRARSRSTTTSRPTPPRNVSASVARPSC